MPRQVAAPRFSYDHDPHMRSSTAVRGTNARLPEFDPRQERRPL